MRSCATSYASPCYFGNGPSVPRNWCLSAKHLEPIIYRWVKPWTAEIPWTKTKGPVYEWACHAGDTMISTILRGARVAEAAAAQKKLNEKESALTWLERSLATGALGYFYKDEPFWDALRSRPRFIDLLRRMGIAS